MRNKHKKGILNQDDKISSISKQSIERSINEQSNFSDKKNQSKNKNIIEKQKKEYSQNENNQDLDNFGEEFNKNSFKNKDEISSLDNSISFDFHDDNKISQKLKNNSDNMEKEDDQKIDVNEFPILEKSDNNIYDDDSNDNKKSQININNSIKNESNYNNFDVNKNYFFGCPLCLNAPYIESIQFDIMKEDFFATYKCKCELKERSNLVNLSYLIIEKEPKNECQSHPSKELVYYCKTCEKKICIDCYKEEHKNHEINNNYLMSEENEKKIVKLMNNFKEKFNGYDILVKIYNEYIRQKIINNIENLDDDLNVINNNDYCNKINNDNVENDPIKLNESHKSIDISKNIFESGFQSEVKMKQSVNNQNFNFKNSSLEAIIKQQNSNINNQNLNISLKKNNKISNLNIDESQNINEFTLFNDLEKSRQINELNNYNGKPKNNALPFIKEENNDNKNIPINEEKNTITQEKDKLKHYYNYKTLKEHKNRVLSLIQLESGYLVSGASDGSIIIWDINKSKSISKFYEIGQILCLLEFEPNILLVGTSENNIGLWDLNALQDNSLFNFLGHSLWVNCLVKIDNNTFASGSNDCNIYVWDYKNKILLFELAKHTDCVITLIKLNDGRLCSGSADLTIKIWNLEKRECELELKGHKNWVMSLY
jgi:WD40 repeat protein